MVQKTQEVEIRVIISDSQKASLVKRLSNLRAEVKEKEEIEDYYYCPNHVKNFSEIEMDKVGSYSLRLRKAKIDNKPISIELNTKVITNEGDHNSWQENEIKVSSFSEASQILKSLGFKTFFTFKKQRSTYKLKGLNILIEDINNFQPILELEKLTSPDKSEDSKKELFQALKVLGISSYDVVPKSVTNILMKKWAKF